jgi:L-iditol 2-dehydrogenase
MKRALIQAPGTATLEEVPTPARPDDGYLLAVRACGVCSWEQRVHRGAVGPHPFAGGHEIGAVVAAGPSGGLAPGTVVAVSRLPRCGHCDACRQGFDNLCAYRSPPGSGTGPGGFAEYIVAAAEDVAPLPDGRTPVEAALVEPLACVLNSLSTALVEPGSRLAVVGNGFMGILHARAATAIEAEVTLLSTGPPPAGLSDAWQGSQAPLAEGLDAQTPLQLEGDFDRAIVIRGLPESLITTAHLVGPGSTICIYASPPENLNISIPGQLLRRKQLGLTSSASHRRVDFFAAAKMVGDGSIAVADLVHRSLSLDRIGDALTLACNTDSGRVVVTSDAPWEPKAVEATTAA